MAFSDLTKLELSGVLRKLSILNSLDSKNGISGKEDPAIVKRLSGLTSFARGAYNEAYGLDVMNKIIEGDGVKAISAVRLNGVATFTLSVVSVFYDRTILVEFPQKDY
jgi:hypothetical protein